MIATDPVQQDTADMIALRNGENAALDRLMMRWQGPLRAFLFRHTQNEFDANDLAQESFVRVYRHCGRFRPEARFSTWLFQIALNLARDRARRLARRPVAPLEEAPELADTGDHPREQREKVEQIAAVRQAIARLPEDMRAALVLSEYEDKSHTEIAEILGSSAKAIETRIYRAKLLLRKSLARWLRQNA